MITKKKLICAAISTLSCWGFSLNSQPVYAATDSGGSTVNLIYVGTDINNPININKPYNLLSVVEGRAGAKAAMDYEFAIGPLGAQYGNTGQIYQDWTRFVNVPWQIDWNTNSNTATFTICPTGFICPTGYAQQSISNQYTGNGPTTFNAFGIWARAMTETGFVSSSTSINLAVSKINGQTITVSNPSQPTNKPSPTITATSPTSGQQIVARYYGLASLYNTSDPVTEITSMSGTFRMNWNSTTGLNPNLKSARSRVSFQIQLFDPPVDSPESTQVPEPSNWLSLFLFGASGLMATKSSKFKLEKISTYDDN